MSKNNYQITDDLLDELCRLYVETSAVFHQQQRQLLKESPEQIKHNLAVAHGVGECLRLIVKHLPQNEERMHGRDIRRAVWLSIIGTECGRNQSGRGKEEKTNTGRGSGSGSKSLF